VIEPTTGTSAPALIRPPNLLALRGFGRIDIAANEVGRLSTDQRSLLWRRQLLNLLAFLGLAFGVGVVLYSGDLSIVGLIFIAAALWTGYLWVRDLIAICESAVARVDGIAWVEVTFDGETNSYVARVGDLKLETTEDVYTMFPCGGPYRLFYVPRSRRLVCAYALEGWAPAHQPRGKPRRFPLSIELGG